MQPFRLFYVGVLLLLGSATKKDDQIIAVLV
jgi:hypothetical protein